MGRHQAAELAVEYPEEGELIASSHYNFRIWADDARDVSLSIDGGAWRPCSEDMGYWWFDCESLGSGEHWARARMRTHDGRAVLGMIHRFEVEMPDVEADLVAEEALR